MRALFGEGAHPNRNAMLAAGATNADTRLGSAYPRFKPEPCSYRLQRGQVRAASGAGICREHRGPTDPIDAAHRSTHPQRIGLWPITRRLRRVER